MMSRKCISVLIAFLLLLAGPLAGCSNKVENAKEQTVPQANSEKEMTGNMYKAGLPVVKDKVTYKLISPKDPRQSNFGDMELIKRLEEKTNIHIEWELVDNANWGQKKNLILASAQYPDAFFMGIGEGDVTVYAPQGVFVKLNDMIEKYAPNLKTAFKQKPLYQKLCTFDDGGIYSIGNAAEDPTYYNPDAFFMYKPWLDKLGLKLPTTTDEFYTTLKAFKEKDPNGNGKADEIPLSFRTNHFIRGIHSLFGPFGRVDYANGGDPTSHFLIENGKVIFTADKPEYKAAVIYLNKFFKEGLFDKEGFTQDDKQYFAKGRTQDVTLGAFFLWNSVNMAGPERANDYVPVPPMKGPSGKQTWTKYNRNSGMINGAGFSITSACKNPEILVRWVDQFYDKKTSIEASWGPVKDGANGRLAFVAPPQGVGIDEFRYKNCLVWPPSAVYAEDYDKVVDIPAIIKDKLVFMKTFEPYMTGETLPALKFTKDETEWNATTGTDLINYVNDMQAKWLLQGGIESEWDGYVSKLKQLKLEEHTKKLQASYDKFMGTK